ncbi:MAG: sulfurtransferase-like selenium metabolism protein YedF [Pelotomaculum sp.]|uniref:Predicted redox protein n=1 Tax=Pelotomaculum thermopropionicum (strain DSM 13744 / JCM 10971 / SI) TaxID=370438 RepID=A5D249_PELTS|nr:sulfurtransferase-like selenium metabolism protein YedF [Pelotomaculum sp.]BAF59685.1 predicted redox protein [Pelotomaculum thermopropionicum SI]
MSTQVIDCRGMACPQPVIETKKALEKGQGGTVLTIVDNEVAKENISRFAKSAGFHVVVEERDGAYHLTISGAAAREPAAGDVAAEPAGGTGGTVYFITTNALGQGSPDLGEVLMKSFMTALVEQQPPKALLLLNTGVFLAVENSPVLEQLQKLARAGTEVLVCGTCLNYYKLKAKLAVGVISNMFEIHSRLTGPYKVITIG